MSDSEKEGRYRTSSMNVPIAPLFLTQVCKSTVCGIKC